MFNQARKRQRETGTADVFDSLGCTPLSEFLEGDAVREALSADTDPFQNPITPQLVQNQMGSQFTCLGKQEDGLL